MFYHFRQNNSGGSFYVNEASGIACDVIVEANSKDEANERAESIGLYFDGVELGDDCDCCGNRWYRAYGDGDVGPSYYGESIDTATQLYDWTPGKPTGYVHYLDGRVVPFTLLDKCEK